MTFKQIKKNFPFSGHASACTGCPYIETCNKNKPYGGCHFTSLMKLIMTTKKIITKKK